MNRAGLTDRHDVVVEIARAGGRSVEAGNLRA